MTKYAGSDKLKEVAWFNENSYGETKPVGLKFPNELGLYDMSGNVREWCEDWFDSDYYKKCAAEGLSINPPGPIEGDYRVVLVGSPLGARGWSGVFPRRKGNNRVQRGGSYFNNAENCRSANRNNNSPENRNNNIGFRLVVPAQLTGKPDGFHRTGDGPVSEYSGRKGDRKRAQKRRHW